MLSGSLRYVPPSDLVKNSLVVVLTEGQTDKQQNGLIRVPFNSYGRTDSKIPLISNSTGTIVECRCVSLVSCEIILQVICIHNVKAFFS